jgi:class 3 adenylate cyclase
VFAHGEVVRLLDQALAVQSVLDPGDATKSCDLLLALAVALQNTGEVRRVVDEVAPRAFELAEALEDPARAARACGSAVDALSLSGSLAAFATPEGLVWLERRERRTAPETPGRVLADVDRATLDFVSGRTRGGVERLLRALETARRLGHPELFQHPIHRCLVLVQGPRRQRQWLDLAEKLLAAPRKGMNPRHLARDVTFAAQAILAWGDRERGEALLREAIDFAERYPAAEGRVWQLFSEAQLAALDGRLEEASSLADSIRSEGDKLGVAGLAAEAAEIVGFGPLLHTGRAEEALALTTAPEIQALPLAWLGRRAEAAEILRGLVDAARSSPTDAEEVPPVLLVNLLVAAILVGDAEATALALELLEPAEAPFTSWGMLTSIARQRAVGAAALGEITKARAYYAKALEDTRAIRLRPEIALTQLGLAELLLEHFPDERAAALDHLASAVPELRAMNMRPALERALRLRLEDQGIPGTDAGTSLYAVTAAVQQDVPDLTPQAAPDGTVTLMFSDMEGFTPMTERLGDLGARDVIREHNAIVREQLAAHGGYEVELQGDGFLLAFGSARQALLCAIAIQQAFAERNVTAAEPIRVRIGLHTGEVIKDAEKFFGKTVILASRIAAQAQGGEILVSSLLKQLTESTGDLRFGDVREVELKGLEEKQRIHAVAWK